MSQNVLYDSSHLHAAAEQRARTRYEGERNTQQLLSLAIETREVGTGTLAELDRQNEVIEQQQSQVAQMQDRLNVAEKDLRSIGSFWGMVSNWFRSDNSEAHQKQRRKEEAKFRKEKTKQEANLAKEAHMREHKASQSFQRTTPELPPVEERKKTKEELYTEAQDRDLDEVLSVVRGLRSQATMMGHTIDESMTRLNSLHDEMDVVNGRVVTYTDKAHRYAKR